MAIVSSLCAGRANFKGGGCIADKVVELQRGVGVACCQLTTPISELQQWRWVHEGLFDARSTNVTWVGIAVAATWLPSGLVWHSDCSGFGRQCPAVTELREAFFGTLQVQACRRVLLSLIAKARRCSQEP